MNRKNRDYSRSEKLQAFLLYQERGIEAVKNRYPQHLHFVEQNAHKSYSDVKDQLLGLVLAF